MANIKLKDLLNEMTIAGGIVSETPWAKRMKKRNHLSM